MNESRSSLIPTSFETQVDSTILSIATTDPSVQHAVELAFGAACELEFFRSASELHLALDPQLSSVGAIVIDLETEPLSGGGSAASSGGTLANPAILKKLARVPVILLVTEFDPELCRKFFRAGVDDILRKPLNISEFIVKLERANSRVQSTLRNYIQFLGSLGAELTITELRILSHFFEQPDRVANRKSLTDHVWSDERIHPKALDVHLFNLRSKLTIAKMKIDYEPSLKGWRLKDQTNC